MGPIEMPIVNQFATAADFWLGMVEPDYQAHQADLQSLRAALHVAFHCSNVCWAFHTHRRKSCWLYLRKCEDPRSRARALVKQTFARCFRRDQCTFFRSAFEVSATRQRI